MNWKLIDQTTGRVKPWECENCGAFGEETYEIEFIGHCNTEIK